MRRPFLATTALLATTLFLAGCAGDTGASAEERMATAQAALANTDAVTIAITSEGLPANADGVSAASGTVVLADGVGKFQGDIKGRMGGVSATISILIVGEDSYMKFFTPDYEPFDLGQFGAPNPVSFLDSASGIPTLMASTTDLKKGGQVREGSEVLTEITGTLTGDKIKALLMIGSADRSYKVAWALTEQDELRRATLSGELWDGMESSYSMLFTDYGKVIVIESPGS